MNEKNTGCCSCSSSCCAPVETKKKLVIDFLYLDLSVCERCQGAESNLDAAVDEVSQVLQAAGYETTVNKVNINSEELAIKHEFLSSPTIRVNGQDIALEVKESSCQSCGDLCGDDVDCRVWTYEGQEHTEPPKGMIVNAILKYVYGGPQTDAAPKEKYLMPENLKRFYAGLKKE